MSIAGVGSHTGYYRGIGMQRKGTGRNENFGKCLQGDGSEKISGGEANSPKVDSRELYEAMSAGSKFADLNTDRKAEEIVGAVTIAEKEEEGEFLGLTMIPEEGQAVTYGMRAMLPYNSTPTNPIVQVISNLDGEKVIYNVEVNKVDPNNATQLEMFALLSYTDEKGISDGGTFGSFHQLKVYSYNASIKGYCDSLAGGEVFLSEQFEWPAIVEKIMQDYWEAEIYNQYEDCKALMDVLGKLSVNADEKEPKQTKTITCSFDTENPIDRNISFTTTYSEEGMVCHREGQAEAEWSITFDNPQQYEKVNEFVEKFPSDWNLVFASREDFWKDLLNDQIEIDSYEKYINGNSAVIPEGMVIEREVVSLPSGISFYMSEDTGEVACIDHTSNLPGRQCLWNKFLSKEDFERCMELFERSKGEKTWEYKYEAYLPHQEFWDMYLNNEFDLTYIREKDMQFYTEFIGNLKSKKNS